MPDAGNDESMKLECIGSGTWRLLPLLLLMGAGHIRASENIVRTSASYRGFLIILIVMIVIIYCRSLFAYFNKSVISSLHDFLKICNRNNVSGNDKPSFLFRDSSQYPKAASASGRLEVIQEQGQTILVPSGWHHQVWNLVSLVAKSMLVDPPDL